MNRAIASLTMLAMSGICLGGGGGSTVPDGTTTICTWYDGRLGAISLTHDDDRWDHIMYFGPALTARGLRGTFNVNPGVYAWNGMAAGYAALAQQGHELASHTMLHQHCVIKPADQDPQNLYFHSMDELAQDCQMIISILGSMEARSVVTMAYPYGDSANDTRNLLRQYFLSARDSGFGTLSVNSANPQDMMLIRGTAVGDSLGPQWDTYQGAHDALTSYMQGAINQGGWVVEEYHSLVAPQYSALNPQAYYDHLDDLVAASASGQLWVAPQGDVARYITSRRATQVSIVSSTPSAIDLMPSCGLNRDVFDVPITFRTKLPADWGVRIRVTHNGNPVAARVQQMPDVNYAVYSLVPDNAGVQITHPNLGPPPPTQSRTMHPLP